MAWVLKQDYGIDVPKAMQPELGIAVQQFSESVAREISAEEVHRVFCEQFLEPAGPYQFWDTGSDRMIQIPTFIHGRCTSLFMELNKPCVRMVTGRFLLLLQPFDRRLKSASKVDNYHEQAVGKEQMHRHAFVPLTLDSGANVFGVGIDSNIDQAAVRAIIAGLNRVALGKA